MDFRITLFSLYYLRNRVISSEEKHFSNYLFFTIIDEKN